MIDNNDLNISLPSVEISTIILVLDLIISTKLVESTWIFVQILLFRQTFFNSHIPNKRILYCKSLDPYALCARQSMSIMDNDRSHRTGDKNHCLLISVWIFSLLLNSLGSAAQTQFLLYHTSCWEKNNCVFS